MEGSQDTLMLARNEVWTDSDGSVSPAMALRGPTPATTVHFSPDPGPPLPHHAVRR